MKISVIIPFYNLERYVNECLDSVAVAVEKVKGKVGNGGGQRTVPLFVEIICVDDGSTDRTSALLDGFAAQNAAGRPRLRVIHQPNGGEGAARNAGMAAATGDWITFLDGDDVWLENHLAVAVPALARHSDVDLISFRFAPFEDGKTLPKAEGEGETVLDIRQTIPDAAILDIGVYPTFYRSEFLRDAAFSKLPLGADRLFVAQCLARANTVVMGSTVIHGYRLRANSMAHCAWSVRKVTSQCEYAFGSLRALAASGKALGRKGLSYLASLWLSDVPNRLLRLKSDERAEVVAHWIGTLNDAVAVKALPRFDLARRTLRACARISPRLAVRLAWILRKGGLT